ncbi:MAG: BON domain-containing protein, partial [Candidatus Angelobacter sp.]
DRIKFNLSHGSITLEGTVDYGYQREATEEAIRVLQGVKHIENRIEVKAPVAPVDLKTGVEKRSSADGRRK